MSITPAKGKSPKFGMVPTLEDIAEARNRLTMAAQYCYTLGCERQKDGDESTSQQFHAWHDELRAMLRDLHDLQLRMAEA